ncbi:hypothetical protein TBLA_0B08900 [Henningerozyma blattae CBS 6284]|uniref:Uncharacterized protein n=1 Tax=Henningerozyma blattae (strain ATCC 34711 / CBS 6284 / DSM 70876 / NBRC 10599 / NRRL Y-10934 / UCD 77-7) TaxID=1071380 RepID=I2H003_HENB6|nr:hypothetical protein TBLA_0B08900 [Tetrapisispora blattae CBS 6284]CCH59705.1 hypothetical protein TBLA_0B08900 [Tetrapisispora blattae CBS 6284]
MDSNNSITDESDHDIILNSSTNQNSSNQNLLSPDSANAFSMIQNSWIENWTDPLPTNKEDRIKQALKLMENEELAFNNGKKIKKHSIRQIAVFFKIPKSTLYDRLKNKLPSQITIQQSTLPTSTPTSTTLKKNSISSHRLQMKISPERELKLIEQIKLLCQIMGNILNPTQIKNFIITSLDDNQIILGKKWVHNFIRRHETSIIYGSLNHNNNNIQLINLRNSRNHFPYLWKCFVPLLQSVLNKNVSFYYITRSSINKKNLSSIFTCFEISIDKSLHHNNTTSFKILPKFKPIAIIFPDFFELDNSNPNSNSLLQIQNENTNTTVTSNNGNNNFLDINLPNNENSTNLLKNKSLKKIKSDPTTTTSNITPQDEKIQKQFKLDKLNSIFLRFYEKCGKVYNKQNPNQPFIIFEGLNDLYNWTPNFILENISINHFLSLPWNQSIFQETIIYQFKDYLLDIKNSIKSMNSTQLKSLEFDLDSQNLDLNIINKQFANVVSNISSNTTNNNTTNLIIDDDSSNDTLNLANRLTKSINNNHSNNNNNNNNTANTTNNIQATPQDLLPDVELNMFTTPSPFTSSTNNNTNNSNSNTNTNNNNNNRQDTNNSTMLTTGLSMITDVQPSSLTRKNNHNNPTNSMEIQAPLNIFEDNSVVQLQDIVRTIEANEDNIFADVLNGDAKLQLEDIFRRLKEIIPH